MMNQRHSPRRLLYLSGFLDLFGVSLLIPLLAHEARKYGASPTVVGLFMSIYGALQFLSSPLMGQASDHFGRKRVLWFCLFGAGTGYILLGFSHSLFFMFLARIPTGLLKHSQAIIKAYMADVTPQEERPAALGTLNALCTSGFIIGPMIGGHIAMTENGFHRVAWLSGLIFYINGLFVLYIIPDAVKKPAVASGNENAAQDEKPSDNNSQRYENIPNKDKTVPRSLNPIGAFMTSVKHVSWSNVADIFLIRFLTTLSMIIFRSSFSVVLEYRHGTTQKMNGYLTSYNAILGMVGGVSVGRIAKFFSSSETMHRFFSVILVLSLGLISAAPNITYVVIGLAPLCISTAVLRVTSATAMYKRGGEQEKGLLTGLGDSITSMARTIGPTIGGIAQDLNIYGPGIVSTMFAVAGTSLSFFFDIGEYNVGFNKKSQ